MAEFKLSAQLLGHEADVRAVSFPSDDFALSASRDGTVRIWKRTSTSPPNFEGSHISRSSEYVNSLAFSRLNGLVISGGKDTIIEVRKPDAVPEDNAERLLIGHANNVCTLDVSPDGTFIVSGGWDGQARVWQVGSSWETRCLLGGHEGTVWSVVALDNSRIATGCADKCIRLFEMRNLEQTPEHEVMPVVTIHTPDVVRALCKVPKDHPSGAYIASASNDGTVRLWTRTGQQLGELHGHESFVYSLAGLPSGELVSAGEDRTVRIWRGFECVQTITHPAISVWSVAVNQETGDIITGASDGIARIFTRRPEATADAVTLKEFHDSVKASAIPQQQIGGINKEKLPGPEFLTSKAGTKEGQVQMIKESNGNVTAHTWSMAQQQWINVGTVVDAVGSTGKKVEYNGKSYDYVFDVDIEDGKPALKLPYNLSENPYERATKFLNDNELPLSYLDNVANFITENTKGATLGQPEPSGGPDPFGTESRYRPGESLAAKVLPQKEYISISAAKYEAILNKIGNVNKTMISSGRKDVALNPGEESVLHSSKEALDSSKPISLPMLNVILKVVTEWPYADRLAGLDLLRCVARFPIVAQFRGPGDETLIDIATASAVPDDFPPNDNAAMMGARTLANLFGSADGRSLAKSQATKAISFLERIVGIKGGEPIGTSNRNVLVAVTTVAVNYSVLANKEKLLSPEQRRRLVAVLGVILNGQTDSEVLFRALVALGTILSTSRDDAKSLGQPAWVEGAAAKSSEDRIKNVAGECLKVISG
ncbi:WD40-repeat-containing domain protein [Trichoderma austrokoningii]